MLSFIPTLLQLSCLLIPSILPVNAYPAPGACTGPCNVHDPALIRREDGTYFRFSTGNKISYASAPAVEGPWTALGSVLPDGSIIDLEGRDDLWAPDIALVNDAYHLYYTVSTFGTQASAIGLATSPSMDPGSWTDHGATGVSSSEGSPYNAIDANLLIDGQTPYMTFGSFWTDLFQVPMNADATLSAGEPYNVAFEPEGTHPLEGPFLFKFGDWNYLFFMWGVCCGYDGAMPPAGQEYKVKVCRSEKVDGGFVDSDGIPCTEGGGTVVLESHDTVYGPGGLGVYDDPTLGPIMYYHYVDTDIGYADGQKLFGWNALDFSSGWPVL
ncbi:arabinan endo-1,5-alpha-L-arabinosidase [Aspergillus candidus]|uniref:Arabinan endo-1,5-alpha-L-arabinosidase n=1 Tax=Aspergillus candidus TaxID=41067 RepID=A0A2I2F3K7_ASPCN|nr:glycosyl hydrolase [Aspergillus candidus]PLB35230.1 glycosyl hydrolase [Aspergillus candidus]